MIKTALPEPIRKIVGSEKYTLNNVGYSDSEVRVYENYVLKIGRQSEETDNEYHMVQCFSNQVSVPAIPAYCVEDGMAYTLMTKMGGKMLCAKEYLQQPELLIRLAAQGLKELWKADISSCPYTYSRLSERLKEAEYNVKNGLVIVEEAEEGTFGPDGFKDPEELLNWLKEHRPEEDLVLTHGDYCLPNIFASGESVTGFIDLGKMGPADRWQDIAIGIRSLHHNFNGVYSDGIKIYDFDPQMFMDELGIPFDAEKYRYYYLLDELF